MILRPYQAELVGQVELQWAIDHRVVLAQLVTGGGKTPILSQVILDHNGFVAAIAHRDKLVEQMSLMLGRAGVRHDLIASEKTKRLIAKKHVKKLGQCWYVPGARCRVVSIDTLKNAKDIDAWSAQVTLWIVDEGHHVLRANKWGKGVERFTHPQCRGLLLTATPGRPDGKGLGRHKHGCNGGPCEGCNDGFADVMVLGPHMRWLIDEGFLCDYDVVCPPSDLRAMEAPKGADGEYTQAQRLAAERASHIVGDIPAHYLRYAAGLSGITFCGTIETAGETVREYRARGVSAELITGDTDPTVRDDIFERAERGELQQIVAVDVISEGVDIPALQVGSFARLTGSIITWLQQLGRLLRPMMTEAYKAARTREERLAAIAASPKPRALLIDHIGGFVNPQLGPPAKFRDWSLEPRAKRNTSTDDQPENTVCTNPKPLESTGQLCLKCYPRIHRACPYCGYDPKPKDGDRSGRTAPEHVDGDLELMDPAALAALEGRVLDVSISREQFEAEALARRVPTIGLPRLWDARYKSNNWQIALRESMDVWAGRLHAQGLADHQIQRAFFVTFGTDVLTAMSLDWCEAQALKERVDEAVNRTYGVALG